MKAPLQVTTAVALLGYFNHHAADAAPVANKRDGSAPASTSQDHHVPNPWEPETLPGSPYHHKPGDLHLDANNVPFKESEVYQIWTDTKHNAFQGPRCVDPDHVKRVMAKMTKENGGKAIKEEDRPFLMVPLGKDQAVTDHMKFTGPNCWMHKKASFELTPEVNDTPPELAKMLANATETARNLTNLAYGRGKDKREVKRAPEGMVPLSSWFTPPIGFLYPRDNETDKGETKDKKENKKKKTKELGVYDDDPSEDHHWGPHHHDRESYEPLNEADAGWTPHHHMVSNDEEVKRSMPHILDRPTYRPENLKDLVKDGTHPTRGVYDDDGDGDHYWGSHHFNGRPDPGETESAEERHGHHHHEDDEDKMDKHHHDGHHADDDKEDEHHRRRRHNDDDDKVDKHHHDGHHADDDKENEHHHHHNDADDKVEKHHHDGHHADDDIKDHHLRRRHNDDDDKVEKHHHDGHHADDDKEDEHHHHHNDADDKVEKHHHDGHHADDDKKLAKKDSALVSPEVYNIQSKESTNTEHPTEITDAQREEIAGASGGKGPVDIASHDHPDAVTGEDVQFFHPLTVADAERMDILEPGIYKRTEQSIFNPFDWEILPRAEGSVIIEPIEILKRSDGDQGLDETDNQGWRPITVELAKEMGILEDESDKHALAKRYHGWTGLDPPDHFGPDGSIGAWMMKYAPGEMVEGKKALYDVAKRDETIPVKTSWRQGWMNKWWVVDAPWKHKRDGRSVAGEKADSPSHAPDYSWRGPYGNTVAKLEDASQIQQRDAGGKTECPPDNARECAWRGPHMGPTAGKHHNADARDRVWRKVPHTTEGTVDPDEDRAWRNVPLPTESKHDQGSDTGKPTKRFDISSIFRKGDNDGADGWLESDYAGGEDPDLSKEAWIEKYDYLRQEDTPAQPQKTPTSTAATATAAVTPAAEDKSAGADLSKEAWTEKYLTKHTSAVPQYLHAPAMVKRDLDDEKEKAAPNPNLDKEAWKDPYVDRTAWKDPVLVKAAEEKAARAKKNNHLQEDTTAAPQKSPTPATVKHDVEVDKEGINLGKDAWSKKYLHKEITADGEYHYPTMSKDNEDYRKQTMDSPLDKQAWAAIESYDDNFKYDKQGEKSDFAQRAAWAQKFDPSRRDVTADRQDPRAPSMVKRDDDDDAKASLDPNLDPHAWMAKYTPNDNTFVKQVRPTKNRTEDERPPVPSIWGSVLTEEDKMRGMPGPPDYAKLRNGKYKSGTRVLPYESQVWNGEREGWKRDDTMHGPLDAEPSDDALRESLPLDQPVGPTNEAAVGTTGTTTTGRRGRRVRRAHPAENFGWDWLQPETPETLLDFAISRWGQ